MKTIVSSVTSILVAIAASTCCIGPFIAIAGMLGVSASQLVWLASIKNHLMAISLLAIGYNLYRAYFPKKDAQCCSTEHPELSTPLTVKEQKTVSIFQSKTFLWCVTALTLFILLLPYFIQE